MDDWSKIEPLSHNDALKSVSEYFEKCQLTAVSIDHSRNTDNKKSPDLLVRNNNNELLFCEIKSPGYYLDPVVGMYLWDDVYNRLRDRLRKARSQLENYDPEHKLPRVVAFTSNHPQLNFTSCQHNILGKVQFQNQVLQDYTGKSEYKYTIKNKSMVDMILWCQVNRYTKEVFEIVQFVNLQSKHINELQKLSEILNVHRRAVVGYVFA